MPPKKGAKKGKKQEDDDDYWAQKEAALDAKAQELAADVNDSKPKAGFGAFEMLDDDDDEGGLLVCRV